VDCGVEVDGVPATQKTGPARAAALVVLMSLVLTSCTGSDDDPGESAPPASSPAEPAATVVDVPPVLDHSSVAGLVPHQQTSEGDGDLRSIATVSVPGEASLDQMLTQLAAEQVDRYERRMSDGVTNELNVGWSPVLAAGPMLGVLVTNRIYTGGAHSTSSSRSVYTDAATGNTWTSAALVSDPAKLVGWVNDAADADELGHTADEAAALQDLRFDQDGSVTVVLGQGEAGAESLGEVAVRVDPSVAAEALSGKGQRVRRAAMAATPFIGIPDPPTPTEQPSTVPPVGDDAPQDEGDDVDCDKLKCIALTFDDGPGPYTQHLLDELAAKDVLATFFLIGQNAATLPDLVRKEVAAGHAIGNHSWTHPQLSAMTSDEIADEVDRTAAAIKAAAGITTDLMRPPYGATNDTVASVLKERGDAQILWNVDTEDWKNRNVAITTQRALAGAAPGAIMLMHDIHPTTVQAVPGIIDKLKAQGYTLVTVPQLLGKVTPGAKYFNR